MSVTVILPDNKRLNIKTTFNGLLSEVLEKVCAHKSLDSGTHTLHRNNRPVDLSLSLRLAGIPLNSELHLVFDANKNVNQKVDISIQYQDRPRKAGQFSPSQTLWEVIQTLFSQDCSELGDESLVFSINFMNKQFEGKDTLQKTTLKLMGIFNGRVMLRMNSRSIESKGTQKFVENIKFKIPPPKCEPELSKEEDKPGPSIEQPNESKSNRDKAKDVNESKSLQPGNDSGLKPESHGQSKMPNKHDNMLDLLKLTTKSAKIAASSNLVAKKTTVDISLSKADFEKDIKYIDEQNNVLLYSIDDTPKFVENNESDDFFEHSASDLKHLLSELRRQQAGNTEANLETSKTREEREKSDLKKFEKTFIRITFPYDRLVIQTTFKPTDSIDDVIGVVGKYTKHSNIHLFTAPPKTILPASAILAQLHLVPSGTIFCASNEKIPLIKEQFSAQATPYSAASKLAIFDIKSIIQKSRENKTA